LHSGNTDRVDDRCGVKIQKSPSLWEGFRMGYTINKIATPATAIAASPISRKFNFSYYNFHLHNGFGGQVET